jgi:hypothetical protein
MYCIRRISSNSLLKPTRSSRYSPPLSGLATPDLGFSQSIDTNVRCDTDTLESLQMARHCWQKKAYKVYLTTRSFQSSLDMIMGGK